MFSVQVEANPPPNVNWQKDGVDVTLDDRILQLENGSLNILTSQLTDSGTWTVIAENGLGQVERKQIELNVHPSSMPITVSRKKVRESFTNFCMIFWNNCTLKDVRKNVHKLVNFISGY